MQNTTDPSLPVVILGFLVLISAILKESSPAIIRWIKSKANYSAVNNEKAAETVTKKTEIATEAQLFLSDVGKSYFTQLEKRSEILQVRLSDYEKVVADLNEQLNKAFVEREKMRIELASLQEDQSEGRMKIAAKTSESVQLSERNRQLETDIKEIQSRYDKSMATIEAHKQETERAKAELKEVADENKKNLDQLEEANRRLDEAYSRFDQERGRADRLDKENASLRKQIEAQ